MKMTAHRHNYPAHENAAHESASSTRRARNGRRRQHLRHTRPMTREQQVALVEEARAARRTAQQAAEAADALMLTAPPDQEWAYGNGWG